MQMQLLKVLRSNHNSSAGILLIQRNTTVSGTSRLSLESLMHAIRFVKAGDRVASRLVGPRGSRLSIGHAGCLTSTAPFCLKPQFTDPFSQVGVIQRVAPDSQHRGNILDRSCGVCQLCPLELPDHHVLRARHEKRYACKLNCARLRSRISTPAHGGKQLPARYSRQSLSLPVNNHSIVFPDLRAKRRSTVAPISPRPCSYFESCPWLTPSSKANCAWFVSNPRSSRTRRPTAFQSISDFVPATILELRTFVYACIIRIRIHPLDI
jgi:hypothetical protein